MVEPSQNEENKSKVQIPEESKAVISTVQENVHLQNDTGASAAQENEECDEAEQARLKDAKVIDQRASNLPIQNPDLEDLLELLNQTAEQLTLAPKMVAMLRKGLEMNRFKSFAEICCKQMEEHGQYATSNKLRDVIPLFEPHKFWDSQPVPKPTDSMTLSTDQYDQQIEVKSIDDVSDEPYSLPGGYQWDNLDLADEEVLEEVYQLLVRNYVEDTDAMFRFDYSKEFLRWALTPPNGNPRWLVGVRAGQKRRLFGMITGIPVQMVLNGREVMCAEINFLCVHKDLRAKRLAPVLIKEITRRVNRCNIWQAIYTAGALIPTPITGATYWHRSLNPRKLLDVRFSSKPQKMAMAGYLKMHSLPKDRPFPELRPMVESDVIQVMGLLNDYLANRKVHIVFNEDEIRHFFLPRKGVVYSYVFGQPQGDLTDVFSFYALPSQVLNNPQHDTLRVAYSYYNVSTTGRLRDGMQELLIRAKKLDFDVFNALDVMENKSFLEELKFGVGDGELHYYLFNWRIKDVVPADLGMVLV